MKEKLIKICDQAIEFGLLAVIFFIPLIFAFWQETYQVFDLNKQVFFRTAISLIIIFFVAKVFLQGKLPFYVNRRVFLFLFILAIPLVISSAFSIHPQLSLWGAYWRQQGLYSFTNYFLFFAVLSLWLSAERLRKIIITAVLSSILVCFYGLIQYLNLDPWNWGINAFLYTNRIASSLGQPNFFAHYLIMVLPLSVFLFFYPATLSNTTSLASGMDRSGRINLSRRLSRFLITVLIFVQLLCLLLTYSRAAWLGLIAEAAAFLFLFLIIKGYKKWALGFLAMVVLAVVAMVGLANMPATADVYFDKKVNNIFVRTRSIFDFNAGSNKMRVYYWQSAWQEFKETSWQRKLIGFGPETQASIFVKYYRPDWGVYETINSFPDRAHNTIFDTWLQFGLIGLFLVFLLSCFLAFAAVKYLIKQQPQKGSHEYWLPAVLLASLAGYFVNNLFSFSLAVGYVYLSLVSAVLVFIISDKNIPRTFFFNRLSPLSRSIIFLFLTGAMAVFIYYYNINFLRADYYYMKAKKAEAVSDCRGVLDNLEKTASLNPMNTSYKERYIYHNLNCLENIKSKDDRMNLHNNIINQADSIGPREHQFSTRTNIARAKSFLGFYINPVYYAEAEKDYTRLLADNPYITTTYNDLGRLKLWQNDYDGAIAVFKKGLSVIPPLDHPGLNEHHRGEIKNELASFYEMLGLAHNYKKERPAAIDYYKKALRLNPYYLPIYKKIADVYYSAGDLEGAIWYNKRGLMLSPFDFNWHFGLAFLYKEKGEKEKALAYAEAALKLAPDNNKIKEFIENIK